MGIFTQEQLDKKKSQLNAIYKRINEIPEEVENPGDLARKITLYTHAQGIIGALYSQSIYEYGHAKVVLKNEKMKLQDSFVGTIKAKEAYAEVQTYDLQEKEVEARAISKRWEAAYNQTEQLANALKKELDILFEDFKAGGRG